MIEWRKQTKQFIYGLFYRTKLRTICFKIQILFFHCKKPKLEMLRKPTPCERGRKKQTPRTKCVVKPVDTNPTLVLQHLT